MRCIFLNIPDGRNPCSSDGTSGAGGNQDEAQCPAAGTCGKYVEEFRAYYVGKEEEVLFEEPMEVDGETWYTGYTKEYVKIAAKTAEPLDNVMKRGRVEAALTDEIYRMKL